MKRTLDGVEKKNKPELVLILTSRLCTDSGAWAEDRSGSFGLIKCMVMDGDRLVVVKEAKPAPDANIFSENRLSIRR